jgi:hypothetical protein
MSGKDRQTLLKIADAWAAEAESKEYKSDGDKDPNAPSITPDMGA